MGKKKDKDDREKVKVILKGNNASSVTGSLNVIEFMGKTILVDFGMIQGEGTLLQNFNSNNDLINCTNPEDIDFVIITHAHCDHSSLIPSLMVKNNFNGKIICTHETAQLCYHLWKDSAFINAKDAEVISKKKGYTIKPFYTEHDVNKAMSYIEEYDYGTIHKIDDNISFKFLHNSHIVGAVQVELYFRTQSNKVKKILITGDLGNTINPKPFVDEMEYATTANLVLMESTYGKKERTTTKYDRKNDIKIIKDTIENVVLKNNHRILIPSFSLDRTQHLLCILYDLFHEDERMKDIPIIVDSKLSLEITKCYRDIFEGEKLELLDKITSWENVKFIKDIKETKVCVKDESPKILISASGFLEAGHSQLYCQEYLPNSKDAIIFVGFSSENSVAGRIKNPESKSVKIGDKTCKKNCLIQTLKTFSSHMQHLQLIQYAKRLNVSDKIVLIHGDKDAKNELREDMLEELKKIGKTTNVVCGQRGMVIYL